MMMMLMRRRMVDERRALFRSILAGITAHTPRYHSNHAWTARTNLWVQYYINIHLCSDLPPLE
jgi:hypothetical protein